MITLASVDLPEPFGPHQGVDLAAVDDQVEPAQDLLLARADVKVSNLELSHQAVTVGSEELLPGLRSVRRENSTSSASVVVCSERMIPF